MVCVFAREGRNSIEASLKRIEKRSLASCFDHPSINMKRSFDSSPGPPTNFSRDLLVVDDTQDGVGSRYGVLVENTIGIEEQGNSILDFNLQTLTGKAVSLDENISDVVADPVIWGSYQSPLPKKRKNPRSEVRVFCNAFFLQLT